MIKRSIFVQQHSYSGISYTSSDSWIILTRIEQTIKQKIKERGTPLSEWGVRINYGIKTGYNEAFIINSAKKEQLISEDPRSAEIIRPILRGRDIRRYGYVFSDLWVINTHNGVKERGIPRVQVEDYPAIKAHLNQFLTQLSKRADKGDTPYNLRNCAYMDDFSKQRIAFAETMRVHKAEGADRFPRFTYIDTEFFHDKTCFIITGDNLLYILAVLNSSVMNYYIHKNIAVLDSGGFLMQKIYIEMMPIPKATPEIHQRISSLTTQIVETRKEHLDSALLEDEIDEIIFKLYGFSSDEVEYIKRQIQEQINLHS